MSKTKAKSGVRTLSQTAKHIGISRQTLARHLGTLQHRKLGNVILISDESLTEWLKGRDGPEEVAS